MNLPPSPLVNELTLKSNEWFKAPKTFGKVWFLGTDFEEWSPDVIVPGYNCYSGWEKQLNVILFLANRTWLQNFALNRGVQFSILANREVLVSQIRGSIFNSNVNSSRHIEKNSPLLECKGFRLCSEEIFNQVSKMNWRFLQNCWIILREADIPIMTLTMS